jgi:hypothetical protein
MRRVADQIKLLSEVGKQFVLILGQDNVKTTMVKDDDAMQVFSGLITVCTKNKSPTPLGTRHNLMACRRGCLRSSRLRAR